MSDFVTLTCPSCGSKLQVTHDIDRFACAYCGSEHIVRRGGGLVSLVTVVKELEQVGVGVDKTASELAIRRLRDEIAELEAQKKNAPSGSVMAGVGWAVVICVLGCIVFSNVSDEEAHWACAVTIMLALAILWIAVLRWGKEHDQFVARIDQEIARKKEELRRHQEIVST